MIAALPRCPGKQTALGWRECGNPLAWNHDKAAWACSSHGYVVSGEDAAERLGEAPPYAMQPSD